MADPQNIQATRDIQVHSGVRLQLAVADPEQLKQAIDLYYKATSELSKQITEYSETEETKQDAPTGASTASETLLRTPVVRTLDLLLTQAIRDRASDIHIEPQPTRTRIRYRVDGVLQDAASLPHSMHASLISRVKILADMNIAERRLPQDGQFTAAIEGKEDGVDVRVATIETAYGEKMVMRLLDKDNSLLDLAELGFLPDPLGRYQAMLRVPHGVVLVCGPTGAGKTTTLYASLNMMDRAGKNILTIEDPVEYRFKDINQIQVNIKSGLTFASGLRAFMRHDPDVILVGEIRDNDTAETAAQAALTGHMVLSSIHANDTEGSIYRLLNLDVDPFLIASSLVGVVAQRMVRRVCTNCSEIREATEEEQRVFEQEMDFHQSEFVYGRGCNFCSNTGYRSRVGLFEVMTMSENLRRILIGNSGPGALKVQAVEEGTLSLLHDGLLKASQGITTPDEVIRNLYSVG
jgi:general secretion pathway protein E